MRERSALPYHGNQDMNQTLQAIADASLALQTERAAALAVKEARQANLLAQAEDFVAECNEAVKVITKEITSWRDGYKSDAIEVYAAVSTENGDPQVRITGVWGALIAAITMTEDGAGVEKAREIFARRVAACETYIPKAAIAAHGAEASPYYGTAATEARAAKREADWNAEDAKL